MNTNKRIQGRIFSLLLSALFIIQASYAQNENFDSVQIKTTKLTESVYMLEGSGGNIGVCIGADGTFMIDDQFAPLTKKIKAAIAKITDKPVQFLINTHFHGDHSGGNENFGGEGTIIVSQENSRKRMEADRFFGNPPKNNITDASKILPKITFTQSMSFYYNGETIQIFHLGEAHTDGDAIIYFKKSDILHMGDVFVRYGFPYIDEPRGGNINGMIETIDTVLNQITDATKIIPGNGQLSSKKEMIEYNNMLKTIRDRVKKSVDEGKTLEQVMETNPLSGFEQRGVSAKDFIKVVYDSILKTKKSLR
ncbi:MAG: MBL fold metallo-hydrolase [Bacteroidota bacterium]